jgi:hypothetical protein
VNKKLTWHPPFLIRTVHLAKRLNTTSSIIDEMIMNIAFVTQKYQKGGPMSVKMKNQAAHTPPPLSFPCLI